MNTELLAPLFTGRGRATRQGRGHAAAVIGATVYAVGAGAVVPAAAAAGGSCEGMASAMRDQWFILLPPAHAVREQLLLHQVARRVERQRSAARRPTPGADSPFASAASGADTHSSATSSVFGITQNLHLLDVRLPAGLDARLDHLAVGLEGERQLATATATAP